MMELFQKRPDLYPIEKQHSIVLIDMWDDKDNQAFKMLETDEVKQTVEEIRKTLGEGYYLMIFDHNGQSVEI